MNNKNETGKRGRAPRWTVRVNAAGRRLLVLTLMVAGGLQACGGGGGAPTPTPTPDTTGAQQDTGNNAPQTLPAGVHPRVLLNDAATLSRLKALYTSQADVALRVKALVDDEMASPGRNYAFASWFAALMYRVTDDTRYADFAIQQVDALVRGEEALISSGGTPAIAHDSYLYVGPTVEDIALVYDWCQSRLSATQRSRWVTFMDQAVTNVWHPGAASWGGRVVPWSGWAVTSPTNNYYYSFLRATMLLGLVTQGEHPASATWLNEFRQLKLADELVPTFARDLTGGGSREGTGYGTSLKELFGLYDWWEKSTGERLADLNTHTLSSMAWTLHTIVPTLDRLAPLGDQARDSSVMLFDYHREYLLSLATLFPGERLSAVAKGLLAQSTVPRMQYGFEYVWDYLYATPVTATATMADLATTYWGAGTGRLMMRAAWGDPQAAYSTFTCGPLTESHAHQDQGGFQIYRRAWLATSGNIYTHSGIQQGVEFNNLVRIVQSNGQNAVQRASEQACVMQALSDNATYTHASARVTPAYAGNDAVTQVEREYIFIKPATFVVFDRVQSAPGTRKVWTLNALGSSVVQGDHLAFTSPAGAKLDVYRSAPTGLSYTVTTGPALPGDTWLDPAIPPSRIEVSDGSSGASYFLHVLGTEGAVSGISAANASGQTGVRINLADGRVFWARFNNLSPGGSLQWQAAGSSTLQGGRQQHAAGRQPGRHREHTEPVGRGALTSGHHRPGALARWRVVEGRALCRTITT